MVCQDEHWPNYFFPFFPSPAHHPSFTCEIQVPATHIQIRDMTIMTKPVRVLRSQCAPTLEMPRTRSVKYGDRAFSAAAPAVWNGLPARIRFANTLDTFKELRKRYFFRQAFNES